MGLRIVRMSRCFLNELLRGPIHPAKSSLPQDVEVVGILQGSLAERHDYYELVCASEKWELKPATEPMLVETAVFTTIEPSPDDDASTPGT